jgi:hypothetical protein
VFTVSLSGCADRPTQPSGGESTFQGTHRARVERRKGVRKLDEHRDPLRRTSTFQLLITLAVVATALLNPFQTTVGIGRFVSFVLVEAGVHAGFAADSFVYFGHTAVGKTAFPGAFGAAGVTAGVAAGVVAAGVAAALVPH